jgi:hypothetical protein
MIKNNALNWAKHKINWAKKCGMPLAQARQPRTLTRSSKEVAVLILYRPPRLNRSDHISENTSSSVAVMKTYAVS